MFQHAMVATPINVVLNLLQAVYEFLVIGGLRAISRLTKWLVDGDWYHVGMKVLIAFVIVVVSVSMWRRLSDINDQSPMTAVLVMSLMIGTALFAIVAYSTGIWHSVAPRW